MQRTSKVRCTFSPMILDTIAPIIPHLRHVTIDQSQVRQVCAHVLPGTLRLPTWNDDVFISHPPQARAAQLLLFNAINFSYWGQPKWTIDFRGRPEDGAWGMLGSIARAVQDEDFSLFDGTYLAQISASDLRHILRGNVEIPMFQQRLDILHEVGRVLVSEFEGSFINLIRAAENDAVALVELLVTHFPSFNDVAAAFYTRRRERMPPCSRCSSRSHGSCFCWRVPTGSST